MLLLVLVWLVLVLVLVLVLGFLFVSIVIPFLSAIVPCTPTAVIPALILTGVLFTNIAVGSLNRHGIRGRDRGSDRRGHIIL